MMNLKKLKSVLSYNPETGIFLWLSGKRLEKEAGSIYSNGYLVIKIEGERFLAHRLAWFYQTGKWPKHQVDHINCIKIDNRWTNLREATIGQNKCNSPISAKNTSGLKGAYWHKRHKRWVGGIGLGGKLINLGTFESAEAAHAAYCVAAKKYHGEFARTA